LTARTRPRDLTGWPVNGESSGADALGLGLVAGWWRELGLRIRPAATDIAATATALEAVIKTLFLVHLMPYLPVCDH